MTPDPVRAGADWLRLREPADAAARDTGLVDEVRALLPASDLEIHDLGSGRGSMARWLAPRLPGPQHWVLHDRDDDLLPLVAADPPGPASDGRPVTFETRRGDITRLDPGELAGVSLVTASALLDMFTGGELDRFAASCAAPGCAVLIALTVTGRVGLTPAHPLDDRVADAFNAHQRRDRGDGRLLGPDATDAAVSEFSRLGREVVARPSPWRLGEEQRDLAAAWFEGWWGAACEQRPDLLSEGDSYAARRRDEAAAGELSVTVHHRDLLVLPAT